MIEFDYGLTIEKPIAEIEVGQGIGFLYKCYLFSQYLVGKTWRVEIGVSGCGQIPREEPCIDHKGKGTELE